jgi:site-specific DNA recombinase
MRAALYARVSSEEQVEGYSIDAQRRAFKAFCEGRDWATYRKYIEEGISARTEDISKRPVFKEMINDALAGKFDVLVVHKLDRFSRNLRITLEYFDKLLKAGVTFVSISEQMDFTTPSGKVHLALLGAFAQYYSDNLSQETKKGWAERRAQGLYCGTLPFGAMKGEDGIPTPDLREIHICNSSQEATLRNYDGFLMAFELASRGKSDREIARALNNKAYRTTGTHGKLPFSRDTVRDMLTNRFYLGYLPNGNGGKHIPFISKELWNQAQEMRRRNATSTHRHCPEGKRVYSLTGVTYCWYCKGRIHIAYSGNGNPRLGCYNRTKGWDCPQKSASLEIYEEQIKEYLKTFHIPEDYQQRILEAHEKLQSAYLDAKKERERLETMLERIKELYKWGDIGKEEYIRKKEQILQEIKRLTPTDGSNKGLQRLAEFLANVAKAWEEATQEQRNRLARSLFQEVWIKDKQVVAVKPQPELEPFFELNYEEFVGKIMKKRPRGDLNP